MGNIRHISGGCGGGLGAGGAGAAMVRCLLASTDHDSRLVYIGMRKGERHVATSGGTVFFGILEGYLFT